jgi:hypothetical protein
MALPTQGPHSLKGVAGQKNGLGVQNLTVRTATLGLCYFEELQFQLEAEKREFRFARNYMP